LTSDIPPEDWLEMEILKAKQNLQRKPYIPLTDNGMKYTLDKLYPDQKFVACKVLEKIREWLTCEDFATFQPLRCTLNGQAGTGKTVLLNTIATVLRECFQLNNTVLVAAPTGTAAFNVNGETLHALTLRTSIEADYTAFSMSDETKKNLTEKFKSLLVLIVDERSMLSSKLVGSTEQIISETTYQGGHINSLSFGGIPVVIFAGDDYQLGGFGEGAHDCLPPYVKFTPNKNILKGRSVFKQCAETVFKLPFVRRVDDAKQHDKDLLNRVRIGEQVTDDDVTRLQGLHLDAIEKKHGKKVVENIKKKAIYLFYTNEKRIRHNLIGISETNSKENPTAVVKIQTASSKHHKAISGHFKDSPPKNALFCIGAKVCLQGKNFLPLWGLHNGACGSVDEYCFRDNQNPNNGDQPRYVVVRFPLYRGPVWDKNDPQCVPLPMVSIRCKHRCCTRTYCPLDLCFARTIHRYQGLGAGPVEEGKIPHMYECIVCDPDEKSVENINTGLFYTALSRGTTLGDPDGLNSAIYFTGEHLNRDRIQRLTKHKRGDNEYIKVTKRRHWVKHLDNNTLPIQSTNTLEAQQTIAYFRDRRIPYDQLQQRIEAYVRAKMG